MTKSLGYHVFSLSTGEKRALLLAGFFFVLALIRDAILLWGYSFRLNPDSYNYIHIGKTLFDPSTPFELGYRTLPYVLMNAITSSYVNPFILIWLQNIIGALAVGALVYVIGQKDIGFAVGIGLLLVSDLLWGSQNRLLLTEGPFISFHLLSLAILINHYDRRQSVSIGELVLAGILYGWTFLFRPANLFLIFLIPLLYFWLTRSWAKTIGVSAGVILLLLLSGSFNLWRAGNFKILEQGGIYVAFPLFSYHIFSPDNGPVSQQLDRDLRTCLPNLDYKDVIITTSNEYIHGKFTPCLMRSHGYSYEEMTQQFTQAYLEAIIHRPLDFSSRLIQENIAFLALPVYIYIRGNLMVEGIVCNGFEWCPHVFTQRLSPHNLMIDTFEKVAPYTMQLYLTPALLFGNPTFQPDRLTAILTIISWLLMLTFLISTTRGRIRFIVLVCLVFIHYVSLVVVAGHVFIPRYAIPASPFYSILTAVNIVTLAQLTKPWLARLGISPQTINWKPIVVWMIGLTPAFLLILHNSAIVPLHWERRPLAVESIQPVSGFSYIISIGTDWMSQSEKQQSPAQLLENGLPLTFPNAVHEEIKINGEGRYSLWQGWLYFSASDNSDPRTNGRQYELYWPTPPNPVLTGACYALALLATLALSLRTMKSTLLSKYFHAVNNPQGTLSTSETEKHA